MADVENEQHPRNPPVPSLADPRLQADVYHESLHQERIDSIDDEAEREGCAILRLSSVRLARGRLGGFFFITPRIRPAIRLDRRLGKVVAL
jgi:hypothetical protein